MNVAICKKTKVSEYGCCLRAIKVECEIGLGRRTLDLPDFHGAGPELSQQNTRIHCLLPYAEKAELREYPRTCLYRRVWEH